MVGEDYEVGPWYIKRVPIPKTLRPESAPTGEVPCAQYLCKSGWHEDPELKDLWEFTGAGDADTMRATLAGDTDGKEVYHPRDPKLDAFIYHVISQETFLKRDEREKDG